MTTNLIDQAQAQLLESIEIMQAMEFWVVHVAIIAWSAAMCVATVIALSRTGRRRQTQ